MLYSSRIMKQKTLGLVVVLVLSGWGRQIAGFAASVEASSSSTTPWQQAQTFHTTTKNGTLAFSDDISSSESEDETGVEQESILATTTTTLALPSSLLPSTKHRWHRPILRIPKQQQLLIAFSTLSGLLEGICIRHYECYPNMMTGNTVKALSALAQGHWTKALGSASMVFHYVLGSALFGWIQVRLQQQQQQQQDQENTRISNDRFKSMLAQQTAKWALGIFILSDVLHVGGRQMLLGGLAVAYGLINASALVLLDSCVTNAATGHWTKVGVGLMESILVQDKEDSRKWNPSSITMLTSFGMGILISSGLYSVVIDSPLAKYMPPLGWTMGVLYYVLLTQGFATASLDEKDDDR